MRFLAYLMLFGVILCGFSSHSQVNSSFADKFLTELSNRRYPDTRNWINNSLVLGRDGSRFLGSLLLEEPNHLLFRLNTSDTITIPRGIVERYYRPGEILIFNRGRLHLNKGLFVAGSIGFATNTGQINGNIGYRFGNRYAAGVGIGFESHQTYYAGLYLWDDFCSLYGFGRYYLTNTKRRLYSDMKLGYGFTVNDWLDERTDGGMLFQPGIGVILPSKKSTRVFASLSQVFQYSQGISNERGFLGTPINARYKIWYNRSVVTIGFEIK